MDEEAGPGLTRLERYLARLPGGVAAYPEAEVRGTHVRIVLEGQARAPLLAVVPPPVRALLLDLPMASDWVPEAHFGVLVWALADLQGMTEADLFAWMRERNRALFATPLYRLLMAALSPERLLRMAGARWGAGHRGTSLEVLACGRDEARLALRFPPRLFDSVFLQMYADSFAVALESTRAHNPRVEVESADDTCAHFLFRW